MAQICITQQFFPPVKGQLAQSALVAHFMGQEPAAVLPPDEPLDEGPPEALEALVGSTAAAPDDDGPAPAALVGAGALVPPFSRGYP